MTPRLPIDEVFIESYKSFMSGRVANVVKHTHTYTPQQIDNQVTLLANPRSVKHMSAVLVVMADKLDEYLNQPAKLITDSNRQQAITIRCEFVNLLATLKEEETNDT